MKKVIGIIGCRSRDTIEDCDLVIAALQKIWERGDIFVSGGCKQGGDRFAEYIAQEWEVPIWIHAPDKTKIDKALPRLVAYARIAYARNELIARDADILVACVAPDRKGGTEHTIKCFLRKLGMSEFEAIGNKKLVLV